LVIPLQLALDGEMQMADILAHHAKLVQLDGALMQEEELV
jgi:hypothetical protein